MLQRPRPPPSASGTPRAGASASKEARTSPNVDFEPSSVELSIVTGLVTTAEAANMLVRHGVAAANATPPSPPPPSVPTAPASATMVLLKNVSMAAAVAAVANAVYAGPETAPELITSAIDATYAIAKVAAEKPLNGIGAAAAANLAANIAGAVALVYDGAALAIGSTVAGAAAYAYPDGASAIGEAVGAAISVAVPANATTARTIAIGAAAAAATTIRNATPLVVGVGDYGVLSGAAKATTDAEAAVTLAVPAAATAVKDTFGVINPSMAILAAFETAKKAALAAAPLAAAMQAAGGAHAETAGSAAIYIAGLVAGAVSLDNPDDAISVTTAVAAVLASANPGSALGIAQNVTLGVTAAVPQAGAAAFAAAFAAASIAAALSSATTSGPDNNTLPPRPPGGGGHPGSGGGDAAYDVVNPVGCMCSTHNGGLLGHWPALVG